MSIVKLPDVGRIQGLNAQLSRAAEPAQSSVELQYTGPGPDGQQWHSLKIPLLDALYLLNLLEAMSKDEGLDHLRRPPAGSH